MSLCSKNQNHEVAHVQVEDLLDQLVLDGELSLDLVKKVNTHPLGHRTISYGFTTEPGFSVQAHLYFHEDEGKMVEFLWFEVGLCEIDSKDTRIPILALKRNQAIPAPVRLALSENLLVLSLRCRTNGLMLSYLQTLLSHMIPMAGVLFKELHKQTGVQTLMASRFGKRVSH